MCMCGKPTVNGEPGAYSWDGKTFSTRRPDPPDLAEGDTLVYDEPGRCGGLDSHCHHFRVVKMRFGGLALLVRHGGGDERIDIGGDRTEFGPTLAVLTSNQRYWFLNRLYHVQEYAARAAANSTAQNYRQAFAEGRLKKRKVRGRNAYDVRIEPKATGVPA